MSALLDDEPRLGALQPLAYGYMRVSCDGPDEKVRRLEQQLRAFAAARGLCFVTFFFEFSCGSREAFEELTLELQRADAHYVVVPSMRHLARNVLLQDVMQERLALDAGAEVLAMRHRAWE